MSSGIPDLIDNRKCTLAQVLRDLLEQASAPALDVVSAFFNLRGLEALAPQLEHLCHLRLLLGKEQEQGFVVGERLLAELEEATARGETIVPEIERWWQLLSRDSVEVRRYEKAFCHGKAYIVSGVPTLGSVGLVGSSNFTGAGLTTNLELNAVLKQASAVQELKSWFDELWAQAEDYKAELLELLERFTRTYTPYEIYIKVIYEALKDRLEQDLSEQDHKPSPIALADFQHDGYLAAKEILENYGGVLLADSVGLGKTFLTLRLLDDYAYRERQTALIICPAAVEDTVWRPLLRRFAIPHEIVSIERLSRKDFPVEDYAKRFSVIVVDESHYFRNPDSNRWPNLFRLIKLSDTDKKVILLTATPVNNTVFDLYHQLRFITRDNPHLLQGIGISDLGEYFRRAEQNKDSLYEVLEALAVRRSRQFIRQNYPEAAVDGEKIRFPERELHTVCYSLKDTYGAQLYQKIAKAIEGLILAPYQVDTYRRELMEARRASAGHLALFETSDETTEGMVQRLQAAVGWAKEQAHQFLLSIGRQRALAHILRVLYLKRLESSVEALRLSLQRLKDFLGSFLKALEGGRLLQSEDYRRWLQRETADSEGIEEEAAITAFLNELPELPADLYDVESLRGAVQTDLQALEEILQELQQKRAEDKLEKLKHLLSTELRGRKVVVFSYFRDTARYIYERLRNDHNRIAIVDSGVKPAERQKIIVRFAPKANRENISLDEQIDLLISTDALAEGQNLQDADTIINYDLHWNPVRIVQRVGRLDRIGSPHQKIRVYNFFPEDELEELLRLVERLHQKLHAINRTVGLDASILGEAPNPMDFNTLRRLVEEDLQALQELEAESDLAIGEFLRQDLLDFLKEAGEKRLREIPLGVGTGRKSPEGKRGFFAAFRNARTNQHHWLFYDETRNRILEHRLEAIQKIRCKPSEPAALLPKDFDPRPQIAKLRHELWNRIRAARLAPRQLPALQRRLLNWLHALPPSAHRNALIAYFEERALPGPDLKELRRLWRERTALSQDVWIQRLRTFVNAHPHPTLPGGGEAEPPKIEFCEEDLECIAWVQVVG